MALQPKNNSPNPYNSNKTLTHLIKYQKIYLLILFLLILLFPPSIRYLNQNHTLPESSSYFHLQAAEQITLSNFYQNPQYTPYHLFLSLNPSHSPFIYQALQLVLALLSLFLLFSLTKRFNFQPQNRFFFFFFLLISPAFIYTFTTFNHYSFYLFLNLLAFSLLTHKKKTFQYLSFPIFALIPFFDLFSALLTLSLITTYFYLKRNQFPKPLFISLTSLITLLTIINLLLKKPFLLGPYFPQDSFINLFSDLGGLFGLSLFALLLAILGLALTWKKKNLRPLYLFMILFLGLFFYQNSLLIYLNPLIIFFSTLGFLHLLHREWKLKLIKNLALFLLILTLLFSTLTNLDSLSTAPPSPETKQSLLWFRDHTPRYKTIFSHPQDSYLIEYFTRKPVFLHYHDPDFKTKAALTNQILHSSYIKTTFPLLEQNQLSHLYLSPQTKAELPTDQGLIFLFQNERFKKIYGQQNTEIWEFR